MTTSRTVLVGVAAAAVSAIALVLLNLLVGPPICVQPAICAPPLPGETGCGPVPETCSGAVVSAPVIALIALLVGIGVAGFLVLRTGLDRAEPG